VSDDLADAERVEAAHFYYGHTARETIEELSRLRAVEQAARELREMYGSGYPKAAERDAAWDRLGRLLDGETP
jgi:hypothetical protein